jgi:hypothetical protein
VYTGNWRGLNVDSDKLLAKWKAYIEKTRKEIEEMYTDQ